MKDSKLIPLWCALIAACVALFGIYYNGKKSLEIENKQFESSLILKSLVPNDSLQSINNIRFLIKAGFLSDSSDRVIKLIRDTLFQVEFPKNDTVILRPKGGFEVQLSNLQLLSGQVLDEGKKGLEDVEIHVFDKLTNKKSEKSYSNTRSDANGLFKVALPNEKSVKITITKNGYKPIYKIYVTKMLKNLHYIPMERIER